MGRREIFLDDRDRGRFLELLEGLVGRYGVVLHAYTLMGNHYHLLVETPHANASRALQWLNVSYAAWFNARHGRGGPVFRQRYKGVPVDGEGSWALACSVYVHLNPVRVRALGLGKEDWAGERAGFLPKDPAREEVAARLAKLRGHRWSSYPAYAGYAAKPEWLTCEALWGRCAPSGRGPKAGYRRYLEEYLRQGTGEGAFARLTAARRSSGGSAKGCRAPRAATRTPGTGGGSCRSRASPGPSGPSRARRGRISRAGDETGGATSPCTSGGCGQDHANPDGDSATNLQEYQNGTDPLFP
jgi:REP element-mobilizing transposase RayT